MDPDCKNDNWPIEDLDSLVVSYIRRLASSSSSLDAVFQSAAAGEVKVDTAAIAQKAKDLGQQISRLIDLYQVGTVPIEMLSQRIHSLNVERDVLLKELDTAPLSFEQRRDAFLANLRRFVEHFDGATLEAQRLLVSSIVSKVLVDGPEVTLEWRI